MKIAVVILNWNGRKMLERYLSNVLTYSQEDATVVVADNASTDDSVEWLRQHHPDVPLIVLEKNWGFADGYNQALAHIEAEYYVLLNSDVEVTHHWLTPLVEFMDSHADVAACQPKLLAVHDHDSFEYAGACGGFIDRYGYPFCRGRIFDTVEQDNGQYDTAAEVLWATGACLMVRSNDYWEVGGLDGRFFAHNEEIDLCWRLRNANYRIVACGSSTVYHLGGATLSNTNPHKTYLNFRNNLIMMVKNYNSTPLLLLSLLCRLILDGIAGLMFICKGQWRFCWAIVRAHWAFFASAKQTKTKRNQLAPPRTPTLPAEVKRYSIVVRYYIKRQLTIDN